MYKDLKSFLETYDLIVEDPRAENLDIISEAYINKSTKVETGYDIPLYNPREKIKKKKQYLQSIKPNLKEELNNQGKLV